MMTPHQYYAYKFTPCCDPTVSLYFMESTLTTDGVYTYIGTTPYADGTGQFLEFQQCYIVTKVPAPAGTVLPCPSVSDLYYTNASYCDTTSVPEGCTSCAPTCYYLIPCDSTRPTLYSTTAGLNAKLGDLVSITYNSQTFCVYVTAGDPRYCSQSVAVTVNASTPCTACVLTCYYISNVKGVVYYVDSNKVLQSLSAADTSPYAQICSYIQPVVLKDSSATVQALGVCSQGKCATYCFNLISCDGSVELNSNTQTLLQYYIDNKVVKLQGYDGCFTIDSINTQCECVVDVTVIESYAECIDCTGYKNYKVTNCETGSIKYTTDDLSASVGKTVEIEVNGVSCPGCWSVELFEQLPPSSVSITIVNTFDNCSDCLQTYWKLVDCNNVEPDIITITDLSVFEGEYIRLTWCPTVCWHVVSTREHANPTVVFYEDNYTSCLDCTIDALPCICVTLKNTNTVQVTVNYYNCDNEPDTITLLPGEITDKMCIKKVVTPTTNLVRTEFGDCLVANSVYSCPVTITPKRTVTPGYNTPGCSPEYYERVLCSFSSWVYGEVLKERYGISPCCSEDAEKWEIKQQLLEYKAAYNPEFNCSPSTTCCGTTNCNCNCN